MLFTSSWPLATNPVHPLCSLLHPGFQPPILYTLCALSIFLASSHPSCPSSVLLAPTSWPHISSPVHPLCSLCHHGLQLPILYTLCALFSFLTSSLLFSLPYPGFWHPILYILCASTCILACSFPSSLSSVLFAPSWPLTTHPAHPLGSLHLFGLYPLILSFLCALYSFLDSTVLD